MMPLPFSGVVLFRVLFWLALAIWILPEILVSRRMQSGDRSRATDRGSMYIVVSLCFLGAWLAIWLSTRMLRAAIPWHRELLFYAGLAGILLGVALRWFAMITLGKSFTFDVAVRVGQQVVDSGPYRFIRHPSYTGALLSTVGLGLALGNWASLAAAPLCLLAGYAYRIHIEEAALLNTLGEPYRAYMRRTKRLIPFLY